MKKRAKKGENEEENKVGKLIATYFFEYIWWWRKGILFARWTVYLGCLSFVPEDMYPPNFVRSDRK